MFAMNQVNVEKQITNIINVKCHLAMFDDEIARQKLIIPACEHF